MKILGIGVDLVEIQRIEQTLRKFAGHFEAKVFTPMEADYCRGKLRPAAHFAARFAAKEAVAKAAGCGIGGNAAWQDIEVVNSSDGRPLIGLHGSLGVFLKQLGLVECHLSLSHSEHYAVAQVMLIGE